MNLDKAKLQKDAIKNLRDCQSVKRANACMASLIAGGYKILTVDTRYHVPKIVIANQAECSQLKGVMKARKKQNGVRITVMTTFYQGCQLMWHVVGH